VLEYAIFYCVPHQYTTVNRNNRQTHDPNSAYKTDRILYINVSQKEFDKILNTDNADIPTPKTKFVRVPPRGHL
jgi:hypothetical protein